MKDKKMKIAIYCRAIFTNNKAVKVTQYQKKVIENFFENQNYYVVFDGYEDISVTDKTPFKDRPEEVRLIKEAKEGKFDMTIITSFYKSGRYLKNLDYLLDTLCKLGIKVVPIIEPYNTDKKAKKFILYMLFRFKEFKAKVIN